MASYRFLQDAYVNGFYITAGDVASTADVGGTLPINFLPPAACDPLDASAVAAFFAAGVQLLTLVRTAPATYWAPVANDQYSLTGLGVGMGIRNVAGRGARP